MVQGACGQTNVPIQPSSGLVLTIGFLVFEKIRFLPYM